MEIPTVKTNSVDPDQTPRSVGLHCLPNTLLGCVCEGEGGGGVGGVPDIYMYMGYIALHKRKRNDKINK